MNPHAAGVRPAQRRNVKPARLQRSRSCGPLHAVIFVLALLIAACGGGGGGSDGVVPPARAAHPAELWEIGPILRGENYSVNMPATPAPHPEGWVIELPQAPGSVHYVTTVNNSLAGLKRITLTYRVEADPGVQIRARTAPESPAILTLYFQRAGDCWTEACEAHRWYASFATTQLAPGTFTVTAPLDANWTAVLRSSRENNPAAFAAALAETARVGFVLGGGDGLGHGVRAVGGAARIVVTRFEVE